MMPRRHRVFMAIVVLVAALAGMWPGATEAALWTAVDTRLSSPGVLALTSPGGRTLVRLPGNRMYAVWYERTGPKAAVVRGAERNGFGEWSMDPVVLSLGDSLVRNPVLAAGPTGDLHLAWEDLRDGSEQIYYRHRTPLGAWEDEEAVTNDNGETLGPVLGVDANGRLHLIWSDAISGNKELYYCQRDAGGAFTPPVRLTNHPGESIQPNFAIDSAGDIQLVWQDGILDGGTDTNFNTEIWYMPLDSDGVPRAQPVRVSRALGFSQKPNLAIGADGAIHFVWSDGRDSSPTNPNYFPQAIWYRRWLPGLGFGHEKRFVFSGADHLNPTVATTPDGTVNIVWEDYILGNSELYYRQITPDTGWDVSPTRLTNTVGPTRGPSLLADGDGSLHLVWSDAGSGEEGSIRYRSGQAGGTTPVRLADARIEAIDNTLRISWRTSEEIDHDAFLLYAADAEDEEARALPGLIRGGPDYTVTIARDSLAGAGLVKLVALDRFGALETVAVLLVPGQGGIGTASLRAGPVHPNPVRDVLRLSYDLDVTTPVEAMLFDVGGRRVAGVALGMQDAGRHILNWEMATLARPAAGRYYLRITAGASVITRGVTLVR
ncbi:MAG TPA: hypothetical protein VF720_07965 [Candidatus Eisenbacteria bacterium]